MLTSTFSEKDLTAEIEAIIDASLSAVDIDWLLEEIMARHGDISGEDADFYLLCARAHVKVCVRGVVRRYHLGPEEAPDAQIVMEGFERLQKRYHIERNGRRLLIRTEEVLKDEMRSKILEYERLSDGWRTHIAELRRYFFVRWNEQA